MYTLEDYDFELPDELIAQYPPEERGTSRLMIVDRNGGITDSTFSSISDYMREGDLLVLNNARVVNARVFFKRESGGIVECVLAAANEYPCRIICNKTKKLRSGEVLYSVKDSNISIRIKDREGEYLLAEPSVALDEAVLERIGEIPLPPYIRRKPDSNDHKRYQTVFAQNSGSVAAPTAGLHFTDDIFNILEKKGVSRTFVTLDVSWGTFSPVRDNDLTKHVMHSEKYYISEESADLINRNRSEGKRVIAVGTTVVRVLESCRKGLLISAGEGATDIFIRPPMTVDSIDALLTNFHTPKSTLMMLVSSFAGYDRIMDSYKKAVSMGYYFFSYGDAMLIV